MTRLMLQNICQELEVLGRTTEVIVVECDATIRRVYSFRGRIKNVCGRGGTDFHPALERSFLTAQRVDLVVYFTDGAGEAPKKPPIRPVIWCLTPGGKQPATWGNTIWMQ